MPHIMAISATLPPYHAWLSLSLPTIAVVSLSRDLLVVMDRLPSQVYKPARYLGFTCRRVAMSGGSYPTARGRESVKYYQSKGIVDIAMKMMARRGE